MRAPPVSWRPHDAPGPSPLAHWSNDADGLTLGLPGLGSIRVSADVVEVLAPDEQARARTWARIGDWATAQWAAAQGWFVVRGSVVARDNRAFAITGGVRCGASLVALVLSQRGWGLVSDGLVVIGPERTAVALGSEITVDPEPVAELAARLRLPLTEAGRPRVRIPVSGHPSAPLSGVVLLTRSFRAGGLTVTRPEDPAEAAVALRALAIRCGVTDTAPPSAPLVPWWRVHRPQAPTRPEEAAAASPGAIATALDPLLSSHLRCA